MWKGIEGLQFAGTVKITQEDIPTHKKRISQQISVFQYHRKDKESLDE